MKIIIYISIHYLKYMKLKIQFIIYSVKPSFKGDQYFNMVLILLNLMKIKK